MSLKECKNVPVYDELNKLIYEFMELNGLEKTLDVFSSECESKFLPCPAAAEDPEGKAAFSSYDAERMMTAFDEGQLEPFFKLWSIFQTHIQVTSDDMKKLEVYIRVHFALWPRAHGQPEAVQAEAMSSLKLFFEVNKSALGRDPAILPLFALPFVDDPLGHPIFQELFKNPWTLKLRNQLESTVLKYFELLQENICLHSRLAELVVKGEKYEAKSSTEEVNPQFLYHQDRFYQLLNNHRKIRKLLQGTRESYAKLLLVTNELVSSMEQSASGDKIGLEPVLNRCYYIFPEIFTPTDTPNTGKPDVDYFKRLSASANFDPTQDSEVSLFFIGISDLSPDCLDYQKIKDTLILESTTSPSDKLCLMQALRWMITKTNEKSRQFAIDAFIANDLLGIRSKKAEYRRKLFHCMLSPTPTYQKECLARLINALSSTRAGRNYLSESTFTVEILVKTLVTFIGPNESFICQMVIASLQKLSLKKTMRLFMIERRVINWLIVYIKTELENEAAEHSSNENSTDPRFTQSSYYNPYLMEYGWALLMNLCLHEESWDSCIATGTDLLNCAANMLLTIPRKDLAPYVVSTLYSLLRSPEMFALARSMQIEKIFAPLLATDTEVAQHMNHLVSLLNVKGSDRITSSRETNYDDEENPDPDVFEPELELLESWTNSLDESDPTGDCLLMQKYLFQKQEPVLPAFIATTKNPNVDPVTGVIVRPVTPSKMPMSPQTSEKVKKVSKKDTQINSASSNSEKNNATNVKSKGKLGTKSSKQSVRNVSSGTALLPSSPTTNNTKPLQMNPVSSKGKLPTKSPIQSILKKKVVVDDSEMENIYPYSNMFFGGKGTTTLKGKSGGGETGHLDYGIAFLASRK